MMEYKILQKDFPANALISNEFERSMNELAREGWKAKSHSVTVVNPDVTNRILIVVILEKE